MLFGERTGLKMVVSSQYTDILDTNKKIRSHQALALMRGNEPLRFNLRLSRNDGSLCHHRTQSLSPQRNENPSYNTLVNAPSIEQHEIADLESRISYLNSAVEDILLDRLVLKSRISFLKSAVEDFVLNNDLESRISSLQSVVEDLVSNGDCVEKIAEILFKANEYWLSDIVCLQNVDLTKAFLNEQASISKEDSKVDGIVIDGDFQTSVDRVMIFLDVEHTEVVLKYGLKKNIKIMRFFSNLVSMATQRQNLKALKLFLEPIAKWNILDEETIMFIEQEVFFKAKKEVIQVFLQSGLHDHINNLFGSNILVALFGNPNVKIGFLKRRKLNVNARGANDSTALHYATKSKLFKRVKYLLDRGAEPNSMTSKYIPALNLALCEPHVNSIENEKCAELLLQYGADPLLLASNWQIAGCCIMAISFNRPTMKHVSIGYLSKLTLAYIRMYQAAKQTADEIQDPAALPVNSNALILARDCSEIVLNGGAHVYDPSLIPSGDENTNNFHDKCWQELEILMKHRIRDNLTIFTILCETGRKLFRLLNEEDCKMITSFIDKYSEDMTLNRYYISALREHMRQVRKLAACKNRAMLIICRSTEIPIPILVLDKITSYLSYDDLLIFQ